MRTNRDPSSHTKYEVHSSKRYLRQILTQGSIWIITFLYIYIWGTVHRNMHLNWKKACTSFPCIPHKQGHFLWIFLYDMEDNRLALNFYLKQSIFMFSVLTFYIAIRWLYRYILLLFLLKEFFGSVFFNDHNPCYFFDQGSQSHQYKWSKLERKCQEFTYTP